MMTPDALKKRVVEEFDSASVLKTLKLNESLFVELPRLFEVSHLSMQVVLNDQTVIATASQIAAKLKRDLQQQGVELEYTLAAQWKVLSFSPDTLECARDGRWMPCESFHVELQSGRATRLAMVRLAPKALAQVRRYLADIPADIQQGDMCNVLEACVNQMLDATKRGCWDPVLYSARTIKEPDLAPFLGRRKSERETQSRLEETVTS